MTPKYSECEIIGSLVDAAVRLEEEIKTKKKALEAVKAKLQAAALSDIENKKIKYVQLKGNCGNCEASYKTKFEIDNYLALAGEIGEVIAADKIARKQEVKYEVDTRFKNALIALCRKDYGGHDIDRILIDLGLTDKALKLARKKLKGDYVSDKAFLNSLGCVGELEEELDAVREQKNLELIERYFDIKKLNLAAIKKAIWLEETLSLTINSNKAV